MENAFLVSCIFVYIEASLRVDTKQNSSHQNTTAHRGFCPQEIADDLAHLADTDDMYTLFFGAVFFLNVAIMHLYWCTKRSSQWMKPRWGWLTEEYQLGEFRLCEEEIKRVTGTGSLESSGVWGKTVTLPLTTDVFPKHQLRRLQQLCMHCEEGVIVPSEVQEKRHDDQRGQWVAKWHLYKRNEHQGLNLRVAFKKNGGDGEPCLELRPSGQLSLRGTKVYEPFNQQGGEQIVGYRVHHPLSVTMDVEPVLGDYELPQPSSRLGAREETAPLVFSNKSCRLYVDDDSDGAWTLGKPAPLSQRDTYSTSVSTFTAREDIETRLFVNARNSTASFSTARMDSGPEAKWRRVDAQDKPGAEASGLSVTGFVNVRFSLVFPRRIDVSFQRWLGATIRANHHIEFQILQVEQCIYGFMQLVAILFILQVYIYNTVLQDHHSISPNTIMLVSVGKALDSLGFDSSRVGQKVFDFVPKDGCDSIWDVLQKEGAGHDCEYSPAFRIASSEVLLPVMMYVFVSFITSSEYAMFSGMDTLSTSREDRWYRRAIAEHLEAARKGLRPRRKRQVQRDDTWCFRLKSNSDTTLLAVLFLACGVWILISYSLRKFGICEDQDGDGDIPYFGLAAMLASFAFFLASLELVRYCLDRWYRLILWLFLACVSGVKLVSLSQDKIFQSPVVRRSDGKLACRDCLVFGLRWFSEELKRTDRVLSTSLRLDRRDETRRQELSQTYIEAAMWSEYQKDTPPGRSFVDHFAGVDDSVVENEIPKLQTNVKVFPMNGEISEPREIFVFPSELKDHNQKEEDTSKINGVNMCTSAGNVAEMILLLSKARRLVKMRKRIFIIGAVSFVHATVPIWHAWLPIMFGGQCGDFIVDGQTHRVALKWEGQESRIGRWLACSETWSQLSFHCICVAVNYSLTFAVMNRLLRCQSDYYARYCHMLYFIQLTPWSNLNSKHRKRHWGRERLTFSVQFVCRMRMPLCRG